MRFEQSGGHMPAAAYRRAKEGWGGFFDGWPSGWRPINSAPTVLQALKTNRRKK